MDTTILEVSMTMDQVKSAVDMITDMTMLMTMDMIMGTTTDVATLTPMERLAKGSLRM